MGIALFLRASEDEGGKVSDSVSHRFPLLKLEWGTRPATSMAVDSLHTVYYGTLSRISSAGFWKILNVWVRFSSWLSRCAFKKKLRMISSL